MLGDIVELLSCPVCSGRMMPHGGQVRCATGHNFDVARQGYVNLLPGGVLAGTADTAAMVRARQSFLGTGCLRPLADRIADHAARLADGTRVPSGGGSVVDVGAGTGYYLAAVLDRVPDQVGLALDLSKHAAARAARAHRRIGAAVCDAWRRLPVRDGVASVILDVCAPRNGAEFRRIARPDGALLVVTPTPTHLEELVEPLGLLSVDARKEERLGAVLDAYFETVAQTTVEIRPRLARCDVESLIQMGPSAHHVDPQTLHDRVAALPELVDVTVSFGLRTYRPSSAPKASATAVS